MARSSNAAAVRAMWDAWKREGIEGVLALVPDDVEWRPHLTGGRPLWGAQGLRELYASLDESERIEAEITHIEDFGEEAVVASGVMRRTTGSRTVEEQLTWLYSFRDGRLWRATAHRSVAEAREAARFAGAQIADPSQSGQVLEIVAERQGEQEVRLVLTGELDVTGGPPLAAAIERAAAPGRTVHVDLSALTFMDSTGLRTILEARRAADRDGWTLRLTRGRGAVQRVFAVSGTERLLSFDPPPG